MKLNKSLPIVLALSILTACGGRPDNVSEDMYNYAESAIKAVDAYMDNEMSFDDTYQKIDGLTSSASKYKHGSSYDKDKVTYYALSDLSFSVSAEHRGSETYAELLESRNNLAEKINYSLRD